MREVGEEINVTPQIEGGLGQTVHSYEQDGKRFRKTTYWYAMTAEDTDQMEPETREQIEYAGWFPVPVALEKVEFDNLKSVLRRFEKWLAETDRKSKND